ncbi:hypothetical protein NHF46_14200 [Arthrobacter alpinus]|nr:hypothetical protein [Arthrobacter alpinus]
MDEAALAPVVTDPATNAPGGAAPPTTEPSTAQHPSTVDIRAVDLANSAWLYSFGGFDLPVEVKLVNGEASSDGDGVPITYSLGTWSTVTLMVTGTMMLWLVLTVRRAWARRGSGMCGSPRGRMRYK